MSICCFCQKICVFVGIVFVAVVCIRRWSSRRAGVDKYAPLVLSLGEAVTLFRVFSISQLIRFRSGEQLCDGEGVETVLCVLGGVIKFCS